MKATNIIILFFILIICASSISAQESKYSLQIDHGISRTSHHRIEAPLVGPYVVYIADTKQEKLAFQMNFSLYRRLNKFNGIILGIGYAEYRFHQKGKSYSDDAVGQPVAYSRNYNFNYINITIGHRFKLLKGQKTRPYLENSVIIDKNINNNKSLSIYYFGISLKSELGVSYTIYQHTSVSLGVFYKSAIYSYGGFSTSEKYYREYQFMPYSYGIEVGVSKKL